MAKDVQLRLLIEAYDNAGRALTDVSQKLRTIGSEADRTNAKTRRMGSEGAAAVSKFESALTSLQAKFTQVGASADKLLSVGTQLATAGAAFGAVSFFPIKSAADFERQMSRVEAVTTGAIGNMDALEAKAKELGRTTEFTAEQVGEGMQYLGYAGLEVGQVLESIRPALNLAAAGEVEVGDAANWATNIMTAFGLEVSDLSHIMDVMAYTASNSNTNVAQLADALKYAGNISRTAKVPFEDVAAFLGVLAKNGLSASIAGTSLRGVLASLADPTPKVAKALEDLGVEVSRTTDGGIALSKTLADIGAAEPDVTKFFQIFRRLAAGAGSALAESTLEVADFTDALTGPRALGAAEKMRKVIQDNLVGAVKLLISAIVGFMIEAGEPLLVTLADMTKSLATVFSGMAAWVKENPKLTTTLLKVSAALAALLIGLGAIAVPLALVTKAFAVIGGTFATLLLRIPQLIGLFKSLGVMIASVTAAGGLLSAAFPIATILATTTAVYKATQAYLGMSDALKEAADARERLLEQSKMLAEKYKDYVDVAIPDDLKEKTKADLQELVSNLRKSIVALRSMREQWVETAKETEGIEAIPTAAALKAQEAIRGITEKLEERQKALGLVSQELQGLADIEAKQGAAAAKSAKDQADAEAKRLEEARARAEAEKELLAEVEEYRLENILEGLAKITAEREKELEEFRSNLSKKVQGTEAAKAMEAAIHAKYDKQITDFNKAEAEKVFQNQQQLAQAELQLLESTNKQKLTYLKKQLDANEITMQQYYDEAVLMIQAEGQKQIDALKAQLEMVPDAEKPRIMIDIELAEQDIALRLQELNELIEQAHITRAEAAKTAADDEIAENKRIADAEKSIFEERTSAMGQMATDFGALYEATGSKRKEFLIAQKAAAIAETIMSTYSAAQKAYAAFVELPIIGPALGIAAAAAAVAAGLARVELIRRQSVAEGGEIGGRSPHAKADNIPIWATAKEWMMPVASAMYYGADVMRGIQKRLYPKEMFSMLKVPRVMVPTPQYAYAEGGQVTGSAAAPTGEESRAITIVNVLDTSEFDAYLATPAGADSVLNIISSNQDRIRRFEK